MKIKQNTLHIAIDGSEANVASRVGSNVYAFEVLRALELITRQRENICISVLLSTPALGDLPPQRDRWQYRVVHPRRFWTQWALPLHLMQNRTVYDVFFTPGHYAPRLCPIPYVSSVMDTAYLAHPEQFQLTDRIQLTHWTEYSVRHAAQVVAISEYTKQAVVQHYHRSPDDILVAYPGLTPISESLNPVTRRQFFAEHAIHQPYILFVGTLQPRKNLRTLIAAFEQLARTHSEIQLVLAGKVGWLAEPVLRQIERSPVRDRIIQTGFITDAQKKALYANAACQVLIGVYEGFGIPPLEAMQYGTLPVVSNTTSLPEVVGSAGFTVDPLDTSAVQRTLAKVLSLSKQERSQRISAGRKQASRFSWDESAHTILRALTKIALRRQLTQQP